MPETGAPADDHGHRATYDRTSADWQTTRSDGQAEQRWLDWLTEGLAPGAAVLDLGCGTGYPVATRLDAMGFAVTGVDFSSGMLAVARERLPQLQWVGADMRAMPDLGRFAAIIAWDSLFHLSAADQRRLLPDLVRRLVRGGRLAWTSGLSEGEVWGAVSGGPVYHASLSPLGYASLLEPLGMQLRRFVAEDPASNGRSVWLWQRQT